jgi:hypothetical protein
VDGDLPGVDEIAAKTTCDKLSYGPTADVEPSGFELAAAGQHVLRSTNPRDAILPIRFEAGGRVGARLRHNSEPLPLTLDVLVNGEDWSRVNFETKFVRFDVWVATRELQTGLLTAGNGAGIEVCGGIVDYMPTDPVFQVLADSRVVVAKQPDAGAAGPEGLSVQKGKVVRVKHRQHGFAEVEPFVDTIRAPDGHAFWVPQSTLRELKPGL